MRRGELTLLGLCQVQVSVYSLSLFCCADSRAGEREPSFMLPRLCLHRQRGQSHNLISSSANNMEPSETALMSEHIRMKRETVDENTRWERVWKWAQEGRRKIDLCSVFLPLFLFFSEKWPKNSELGCTVTSNTHFSFGFVLLRHCSVSCAFFLLLLFFLPKWS